MTTLNAGLADCSTGIAKRIYDQLTGDTARNLFSAPLSAGQDGAVKSLCYAAAKGVADEINADGGVGGGGSSAPTGHELDANTIALWRFNSASPGADDAGNYALTDNSSAQTGGLVESDGARRFPATTNNLRSGVISSGQATDWAGTLTVEALVLCTPVAGTILSCAASGETLATNFLFWLTLADTLGSVKVFWEHDAGVDVSTTMPSGTVPLGRYCHIAAVRTVSGGSASVSLYVNGIFRSTVSGLTPPNGGTSAQVSIGQSAAGDAAFTGLVDEIRVSKVARTASEILASAKACGVA